MTTPIDEIPLKTESIVDLAWGCLSISQKTSKKGSTAKTSKENGMIWRKDTKKTNWHYAIWIM